MTPSEEKNAVISANEQEVSAERKDTVYEEACKALLNDSVWSVESAISKFERIPGWRDANEKLEEARRKLEAMKQQRDDRSQWLDEQHAALEQRNARAAKNKKLAKWIGRGLILACLAAIIATVVFFTAILPEQRLKEQYQAALALMNEGKYEEAYTQFEKIDYADSAAMAEKLLEEHDYIVKLGSIVEFGSYEQDNDLSNGKEPIEWIVLDKVDGKILLISNYALDHRPYNAPGVADKWDTCILRSWLNEEFYNEAFTPTEQERISLTSINITTMYEDASIPMEYTEDYVFLLTVNKANQYFPRRADRDCQATPYAKAQGAFTGSSGACRWWLHSPGYSEDVDSGIYYVGGSYLYDEKTTAGTHSVRPAIWITPMD